MSATAVQQVLALDLKPSALKHTLTILAWHHQDNHGAYPSVKTLMTETGKSEAQVRKDLAELKSQCLIVERPSTKRGQRTKTYDLTLPVDGTAVRRQLAPNVLAIRGVVCGSCARCQRIDIQVVAKYRDENGKTRDLCSRCVESAKEYVKRQRAPSGGADGAAPDLSVVTEPQAVALVS